MYDAFVAMFAVGMLIFMIRHNKTSGAALYILIIVSMIVGSAPRIQGFLAPMLNGIINAFTGMLGFPSTAGGATYTVGVLAIATAILAVILWDKTIKKGELVPLVIACMIVGTTPLITSWLPLAINSTIGAFGFA
jgi:hypothetical protein